MKTTINRLALSQKRSFTLALICVIQLVTSPFAMADDPIKDDRPLKIGLALEGGGALGFAHVGVLKVLEENQIPVHFIAGTSMGALVGAAYASGQNMTKMESVVLKTNWDKLFDESIPRDRTPLRFKPGRGREIYGSAKIGFADGSISTPTAVIQGQNVMATLSSLYELAPTPVDFDDLPIPFRAVAADLETGEALVLDSGDLSLAARASMSVPGVFAPVELNGKLLVDGGMANNLPINVVREMGADVVIAVSLETRFSKGSELKNPLAIAGQVLQFLIAANSRESKKLIRPTDIHIAVDVQEYGSTSFPAAKEIYAAGLAAGQAAIPALKKLRVSHDEYRRFVEHRETLKPYTPTITNITVKGLPEHVANDLKNGIHQPIGQPLDRKQLQEDVDNLYYTGTLQQLTYSLEPGTDGHELVLNGKTKDWYWTNLRLGFAIEDNFRGTTIFRLGAAYRAEISAQTGSFWEAQGEVGTKPRLSLELYQPFSSDSPFFVAPLFELSRNILYPSLGDNTLAQYRRDQIKGEFRLGAELEEKGEISIGYRGGYGELSRQIGSPELPEPNHEIGEFVATLDLDTLDNVDFPHRGYTFKLAGLAARDELLSAADFEQYTGFVSTPVTLGTTTFLFRMGGGYSTDGAPVPRWFTGGGFLNVSGATPESILASSYYTTKMVVYDELLKIGPSLLEVGVFLGASIEYGSYWADGETLLDRTNLASGSVFVGADSPLMPLYLGFGYNDDGQHAIYFALGRAPANLGR